MSGCGWSVRGSRAQGRAAPAIASVVKRHVLTVRKAPHRHPSGVKREDIKNQRATVLGTLNDTVPDPQAL